MRKRDEKRIRRHVQKILYILDDYQNDKDADDLRESALCMQKKIDECEARILEVKQKSTKSTEYDNEKRLDPYENLKKMIARAKEEVEGPGYRTIGNIINFLPDNALVHIHSSCGIQFVYAGDKTKEIFQRLTCEEARRYLTRYEKNIGVHAISMDMDYLGGNTKRPVAILEIP